MANDKSLNELILSAKDSEVSKAERKKRESREAKNSATLDFLAKTVKEFKADSSQKFANLIKTTKDSTFNMGDTVKETIKDSFKEYSNDLKSRGSKTAGDITGAIVASLGPYGYLLEKTFGVGKSVGGTLNKLMRVSKGDKSETEGESKSLDAVVQAIKGDKSKEKVYGKLDAWLDTQAKKDKSYARMLKSIEKQEEQAKKALAEQRKIEKENKQFRALQNLKTGLIIAGIAALTGAVIFAGLKIYDFLRDKKIPNLKEVKDKYLPTSGVSRELLNKNINVGTKEEAEQLQYSASKKALKSWADNLRITSPYGERNTANLPKGASKYHYGIDIATGGGVDVTGMPVKAPFDGYCSKITDADKDKINGNGVWITREDKKYTVSFIHLQKRFVKQGQKVKKGQVVGTVGNTGLKGIKPHLDARLRKGGKTGEYLDIQREKVFTNKAGQLDTYFNVNKEMLSDNSANQEYPRAESNTVASELNNPSTITVEKNSTNLQDSSPSTTTMGKTNAKLQNNNIKNESANEPKKERQGTNNKVSANNVMQPIIIRDNSEEHFNFTPSDELVAFTKSSYVNT